MEPVRIQLFDRLGGSSCRASSWGFSGRTAIDRPRKPTGNCWRERAPSRSLRCWGLAVLLVLSLGATGVSAQDSTRTPADTTVDPWYETAWTPIVERKGVEIAYLFYAEADNENNGVVLRLRNQNEYPVRYAFTVVFRGPEAEATARAEGRLAPGEMKTGENDGLFWVPFEETGHSVGEIGLRAIQVVRLREHRSAQAKG